MTTPFNPTAGYSADVSAARSWEIPFVAMSIIAMALVLAAGDTSALRVAVGLVFGLVSPGVAIMRHFDVPDPITKWTLVVVASMCTLAAVATPLVILGVWSPWVGFTAVSAMSAAWLGPVSNGGTATTADAPPDASGRRGG